MVEAVQKMAEDWDYDVVSIGYPGQVGTDGPRSEPGNLGPGWVGFNFPAAFDRPVRILNDASVQGYGVISGSGVECVITLGTGVGFALYENGVLGPHMELGRYPVHKMRECEVHRSQAPEARADSAERSRRHRRNKTLGTARRLRLCGDMTRA